MASPYSHILNLKLLYQHFCHELLLSLGLAPVGQGCSGVDHLCHDSEMSNISHTRLREDQSAPW